MHERRTVIANMLASAFAYAFVRRAYGALGPHAPIRREARHILRQLDQVSKDLAAHRIEPAEWQMQVKGLLGRLELADLMRAIDFDWLANSAIIPEDHEFAERIVLGSATGLRKQIGFAPFFFAMNRKTAIVPHGHHNIVSMHLVLQGRTMVRRFERIQDDGDTVIIRPCGDEVSGPGAVSTVSDQKHNVHWFTAESDRVLFFNIQLWDLQPGEATSGRNYLDPDRAESAGDGRLRVGRLSEAQAYARYRATPG